MKVKILPSTPLHQPRLDRYRFVWEAGDYELLHILRPVVYVLQNRVTITPGEFEYRVMLYGSDMSEVEHTKLIPDRNSLQLLLEYGVSFELWEGDDEWKYLIAVMPNDEAICEIVSSAFQIQTIGAMLRLRSLITPVPITELDWVRKEIENKKF